MLRAHLIAFISEPNCLFLSFKVTWARWFTSPDPHAAALRLLRGVGRLEVFIVTCSLSYEELRLGAMLSATQPGKCL